ncbi:MAG: TonB-dependent receptor [Acidobacteriia bacterium]|nr:TonB-dependent receptor [Terriglobia bacterium]
MKRAVLVMIAALLVSSAWLYAQVSTGTITGEVSDSSGAVVGNAQVRITDVGKNVSRVVVTDSSGLFSAPDLLPGNYSVAVSLTGFQSQSKLGLALSIGQTITTNFVLRPGSQQEYVTVVGLSAQLIDTTTSSLSDVVTETAVQNLPLNGRDFQNLIPLAAGVAPAAQGALAPGVSTGLYDINGGRSAGNSFLIDGTDVVPAAAGAVDVLPNLEAVGEFQVVTSNFSAEYGRTLGGVINAHLRSGTNSFHGSIFEYFRNDVLDATPAFSPTKLPYKFNQYGGSLGGPILKNKLFFFGDYQGERVRQSATSRSSIPLPSQTTPTGGFYDYSADCAANGGTFVGGVCSAPAGQIYNPFDPARAPFPNNQIPENLADPTTALMFSLLPAPNCVRGSATCPANNYITSQASPLNQDSVDVHVDYNPTSKDRLSFSLIYISNSTKESPLYGPRLGGSPSLLTLNFINKQRLYALNYTRVISPRAINELILACTRDLNDGTPGPGMQYEPTIAGLGGLNTSPDDGQTTGFPLLFMLPDGTNFGGGLGGPFVQHNSIPQLADNFSWMKGRHAFKTGFIGRFREFNLLQSLASRGLYVFFPYETGSAFVGGDTFASALLGVPLQTERQIIPREFGQRIKEYGVYFQDNFKATKRLTLNLGVRWDLYGPASEAQNRLANFDPTTLKMVLPGNGASASTLDTNYRNFGPHVGFAYALTEDGKTSLRGGYGISYVPLATQAVGTTTQRLNQNTPFGFAATSIYIGNAFGPPGDTLVSDGVPVIIPSDPTVPPVGSSITYIPKSQPTPYAQQWNLDIQRMLPGDVLLDMAYVGTTGVHLTGLANINQYPPGTSPAASPISPDLSVVGALLNVEQSNYHGLQVKAQRRFSSGFGLSASYTFSRSIDNGSVTAQPTSASSAQPQNAFDFQAERGPSDFNATHRVVVSYIYELPFGKGKRFLNGSNPFLSRVLGGWQLNGITSAQTGSPFTPVFSGADAAINAGSGGSVRPNIIGNPYSGTDPSGATFHQSRTEWFNPAAYAIPVNSFGNAGRNSLTGPGFVNFDFSLFKSFQLERFKLEFRSEFFNVFNHTNLGLPNSQVDAASGGENPGQILNAAGNPRQVQFALKLLF